MLFKLPGSQRVVVCFTAEGSPEPSRLSSRSQAHPCSRDNGTTEGTHTHTRMHTHARTHSSSTPAVSGFYLTARVLVCPPAIHAHLVRFQTAAFWVLGVNSGHSESPAKEGAWPSTLNFFKPELFEDSTESGRVFREGLRPRGCSLTWLVGLGRGQELRASAPRASAVCHSASVC